MVIRLENWSLITSNGSGYQSPEQRGLQLAGNVYGHPRFKNGHPILSSEIIGYKDGVIITFSGSKYELGEVDPNYELKYPDAKNRVEKLLKGNL